MFANWRTLPTSTSSLTNIRSGAMSGSLVGVRGMGSSMGRCWGTTLRGGCWGEGRTRSWRASFGLRSRLDLFEAGVDYWEAAEAREVAVGRPEFFYSVGAADGVNAGVVNLGTAEFASEK